MKGLEKKQAENDNQSLSKQDKDDEYTYQYDRTKNSYSNYQPKGKLFYFDPNKISGDGWEKLGLRDKTIQTIQNYLRKGGHFKKPEDLQKVYGLRPEEYERLASYIQIESASVSNNEEELVPGKKLNEDQQVKNFTPRYSAIEINSADTTAFITLPGIGSKLAARIVNFREKLGGFYSIEQVGETFGLPDSTFQKIKQYLKLENPSLKKININTASIEELKAHPYIKWGIANPIVAYRNEHGNFTKLEDIKKIVVVTDVIYQKIIPYLTTQ
jgi:competence ComEA-like helix-hairpin-helix protein